MIRRTFDLASNREHPVAGQILVTYNADTDTVHVAYRPEPWDVWSRPLNQTDAQDDLPHTAGYARRYSEEIPEETAGS